MIAPTHIGERQAAGGPQVPGLATGLQAIIFDVDGTLYRHEPVRRFVLSRLALASIRNPLGTARTIRILRHYRRAQELLRGAEFDGRLDDAQIRLAARNSGASEAQVSETVQRWMEDLPLPVVARAARPGLLALLEKARASHIRIAALSDYPPERKLKALGVLDYFDSVVYAQQESVQRFKPDPRGLLAALSSLDVPAERALYVGDRPDVDFVAADAAGVKCLVVTSSRDSIDRTKDCKYQSILDFFELMTKIFPG